MIHPLTPLARSPDSGIPGTVVSVTAGAGLATALEG
jgi:hypothetical protein